MSRQSFFGETAVTHDGPIHLDDALGGVIVGKVFPGISILRSRDEDVIERAYLAFDISGIYDHSSLRYDHHQGGIEPRDENGVMYAASGLLWRHYGVDFVSDVAERVGVSAQSLARRVELDIIWGADAIDNGQVIGSQLVDGTKEAIKVPAVHEVIENLAPMGQLGERSGPGEFDLAYTQAVRFAEVALNVSIRRHASDLLSAQQIEPQLENQKVDGVLVLKGECAWQTYVIEHMPEIYYVVYPHSSGSQYSIKAVPLEFEPFKNRRPLPSSWAGKSGEELQAETGVEDAIFCHKGCFTAAAKSLEGAVRLARLAVPKH